MKINKNIVICLIAIILAIGCRKDMGNYDYKDINEIRLNGLKGVDDPYQVILGSTLEISPNLQYTQDANPDTNNYTYRWELGTIGSLLGFELISTQKDLKYIAKQTPGKYELHYKVKDKRTGVEWQAKTYFTIVSQIFEGYLVLNDVNGTARLDMLSYKSPGSFEAYTDVLKTMNSSLKLEGAPLQVSTQRVSAKRYDIYLLTDRNTNFIDSETFDWSTTSDIRYRVVGDVPAGFKADNMVAASTSTGSALNIMYGQGNLYSASATVSYVLPINQYQDRGRFSVSPITATDGNIIMAYNMDSRSFVTNSPGLAVCNDAIATWNMPQGYDLVYMETKGSAITGSRTATAYAVMKHPTTGKFHLLNFIYASPVTYFQEILGTDIERAQYFAVSPDLGYLFYSVGGKVYEYDLSLKKSKLMLDKGQETISYLAFQKFYTVSQTPNARYTDWNKLLTVGSYLPGGIPGANGTITQYTVPPVNGDLIERSRWTGFGKIVSVAYRER